MRTAGKSKSEERTRSLNVTFRLRHRQGRRTGLLQGGAVSIAPTPTSKADVAALKGSFRSANTRLTRILVARSASTISPPYFREDDHVWDSHALFSACESPGPGILVHPTRGTVMVACRSIKVSDKLEESAGETTAEMEFVEANIGFSGILGSIFGIISTGLFATSQTSFLRDYTPTAGVAAVEGRRRRQGAESGRRHRHAADAHAGCGFAGQRLARRAAHAGSRQRRRTGARRRRRSTMR